MQGLFALFFGSSRRYQGPYQQPGASSGLRRLVHCVATGGKLSEISRNAYQAAKLKTKKEPRSEKDGSPARRNPTSTSWHGVHLVVVPITLRKDCQAAAAGLSLTHCRLIRRRTGSAESTLTLISSPMPNLSSFLYNRGSCD